MRHYARDQLIDVASQDHAWKATRLNLLAVRTHALALNSALVKYLGNKMV
jgi:hypothetical protein